MRIRKYTKYSVYCPTYILKKYTDNMYKLVFMKALRRKGFEEIDRKRKTHNPNDKKLVNSISRSRAKIFEYAICNEFEYFVTLTIDSNRYDRTNLKNYYKDFSQFLRNYRIKYNINIQYLFIPELHKDGKSWHMHGFITGIPKEHFTINEHGYLDWLAYKEKFGYISLDKIRDKKRCSLYITKYVSKNIESCITDLNAKMYYASRDLKTAVEVKRGELQIPLGVQPDFTNEYVKIYWLDNDIKIKIKESSF